MNDNQILGEKFAKDFNKKYGIITYSGTLAIELALCDLKKGSKVLIISEACYSIVNTILKLGLIPVIVSSKNQIYLTNDDIDEVLNIYDIDCLILVHQYGIYNDIDLKKYKSKGIRIIEDVAQAWDIRNETGLYSDVVVTSFGKTKPLSLGIGGGVFSNDKTIYNNIDYCDNDSREKDSILYSYAYPLCQSIDYDKLKEIANNIVNEQRINAKKYYDLIKDNKKIECIEYNPKHVWHRFPIWILDYNAYLKVIKELEKTDLEYQLLHEIKMCDLKRNIDCIKFNNNIVPKNIILLRTRNVDIKKQLMILEKIIKNNIC